MTLPLANAQQTRKRRQPQQRSCAGEALYLARIPPGPSYDTTSKPTDARMTILISQHARSFDSAA